MKSAIAMMLSGAIVGMLLVLLIVLVSAVPIRRVDTAIRNATESVIDYVSHADDWWRDSPEPGPK